MSQDVCEEQCRCRSECVAFTYNPDRDDCYLKETCNKEEYNHKDVSGFKLRQRPVCWADGKTFFEGQTWTRGDGYTCSCSSSGAWTDCKVPEPKKCWAEGRPFWPGQTWAFPNGKTCSCSQTGSWTDCQAPQPQQCWADGKPFWPGQTWAFPNGKTCSCSRSGAWTDCQAPEPRQCWANGRQFSVGETWTRNDGVTCSCSSSGAWTDCKARSDPAICSASGMPFGLENCACDGAKAGQTAAEQACSQVQQKCGRSQFTKFSAPQQDSLLEQVQKICDTFAQNSCIREAPRTVVKEIPQCEFWLDNGFGSCSAEEATSIFQEEVEASCAPLCTDCVRF